MLMSRPAYVTVHKTQNKPASGSMLAFGLIAAAAAAANSYFLGAPLHSRSII